MSKPAGIAEVETADRVFSALAHPARRQILLSVHYREVCSAGEIARRFDCSWPTTSRHLATLVECGLLSVERRGRERLYRTDGPHLKEVLKQWAGYFS
ncbi:MAG: metalloregulator ArsR/SmtB family transcription factor [Proteobacteria bacterium]|nr:metalloregulator ArsR/SmtB family transcription factor [Pseudomonadota bacterium]